MRHFIILSLLIGFTSISVGQDISVAFEKVMEYYENQKKYELTTKYSLYRGYTRDRISEQYESSTIRDNNLSYIKVLNTEVIQNNDLRVVVDHETKQIHYQPVLQEANFKAPVNLASLSQYYYLKEENKKDGIQCLTLQLKNEQLPIDYSIIKLYINTANYSIVKQELFSSRAMKFYNEDGSSIDEKSLLVIEFKQNKLTNRVPQLNDFIVDANGESIQATPQYYTYQIIQTNK